MAEGIVIGNLTIPVIKGDKGDKGNTGEILSISLVLLSPSSTAYAINNGSTTQAQIELGIPKGLSVSTTNINASGELVFTFNDNSTVNVGKVVGKGISEVTVTDDFDFVVTYTDGTSVTACNLEDEVLGTINDILEDYYTKTEIDEMGFITKEVNNLTNYTLKTNTGSSIELSINTTTYVMTLNLKNSAGTVISTGTIDLPLETMVVGATYDNTNKKIVLTLKNGSTIDVPVADLVSGLQSEITNANKLSADLVDDTSTTHKFTSTSEKNSWNAKYDKPSGGIPSTDMSSSVQTSLEKADTALQEHQDISGKEDTSNKTGTLDSSSTITQYPNAKTVYDNFVTRDEEIEKLQTENAQLLADHPDILDENNEFPSGTDLILNGTGDLKMKVDVGGNSTQGSLPNEYQQVEYIESSGTQYIDTGVIPNSYTGVEISASVSVENSADKMIMGSREGDNRFWIDFDGSDIGGNHILVGYGDYLRLPGYELNTIYNIKFNLNNNKKIIVNNTEYSLENYTYDNTNAVSLYMFRANYSSAYYGSFKCYMCKIYSGSTIVRDFIPCYRKSDNVIGLYDVANNAFYTNQGTGTFTKGNDIPNSNYKQDINNVEGDVEVKAESRNVFKPTLTNNGTTIFQQLCTVDLKDDEFTFIASGTNFWFGAATASGNSYTNAMGQKINVKGKSKIYFLITNSSFNQTIITAFDENDISLGYVSKGNNGSYEVPENVSYVALRISSTNGVNGTTYKTKVMVSYDPINEYFEYKEPNTVTFPLSQGQKLMLGDTLEDDGIHHKRTRVRINSNQLEKPADAQNVIFVRLNNYKGINGLCTHFTNALKFTINNNENADTYLNDNEFNFRNQVLDRVYFKCSNFATLQDWQDFFTNNEVYLEYELATETTEQYTSAQQTAYNKLKEMQSYYDLTYVVGSSNNAQPIITAHAKKSIKELSGGDLSNYVENTDYATSSTGGVIKTASASATDISSGVLQASTKTYSDYTSGQNTMFIGKGTLENVITGKGLTNVAHTNSNNNFSTAQTINGTLTVVGDISQTGTTYETHAEQLYTAKDIIKTRDGAVGGLGNNEVTGIEAIKYDGTNNGRLIFDNTGTAKVGDVGDEVPLLARDESTNMTNNYVMTWDSTDLIAKTSFGVVTLTQSQYDALVSDGTVDSNTFYYTTEDIPE